MSTLIMIRTFEEQTLLEMAEHATVPVINGLTNRTHPCQIMADVMTFEEHRGPIAGAKVVWSGDGNNVFASFAHAAGQFGFDLTFTGPETLDPERAWFEFCAAKGRPITVERDPDEGRRRRRSGGRPTPGCRCTMRNRPGSGGTTSCAPTR